MKVNRSDEWSYQEDMLVVETVIKGVSEGRTQLDCFDEVAEKLGRTAPAVGFRWNKALRSEYKSAFERAQQIRREAKADRRKVREKQRKDLLEHMDIPLTTKYVDPDFDEEWCAETLNENTTDVVTAPQSRVQSQTIRAKVYSLNGITEAELVALGKILEVADSEILQGLRYDIQATLSR